MRRLQGILAAGVVVAVLVAVPVHGASLGDILYSRNGAAGDEPPAYFPHWVHRIRYRCYACHDSLYPMERGANPTMAAMKAGSSCGACHNGRISFGVDQCQRCHQSP